MKLCDLIFVPYYVIVVAFYIVKPVIDIVVSLLLVENFYVFFYVGK
jgi:hypothetical protein